LFGDLKVWLSWTPRTALLSEIATLLFPPAPRPGRSGSPGSARPSQRALANVAVLASPADSIAERSLEAVEARVNCRRLISIGATAGGCQVHRPFTLLGASLDRGSPKRTNR
jgi:hypothetical protein